MVRRRMPFSATRDPLPDVGAPRGQRSRPTACSNPEERGGPWRRTSRRRPFRCDEGGCLQCRYLLMLPKDTLAEAPPGPKNHRGFGQRQVAPRPLAQSMAKATPAYPKPRISSSLQPRPQPHRAGLETCAASLHSQSLLPRTHRPHYGCAGTVHTLESPE